MNKCSKKIVVDYRTDIEAVNTLMNYGFNVFFTKELTGLYDAVQGHADLQIVKAGNNIITCPECYEYYKSLLNIKNIISGKKMLKEKYPEDIAYNAAISDTFAIHNFKFTDSVLKEYITEKNLIKINTKQGYSKCSVCIISDDAIITDDEDIYKNAIDYKLDVLKIEKGSVKLKGFDYGFFGGATGVYENKLFINGELKFHTNANEISYFCKKHNITIIELKKGEIYDIGSILFI